MSLLPNDAQHSLPPSGADYLFGLVAWLASAVASLFLAIFGVGHLIVRGPSSQFGYEWLLCFAAPVLASIAYALALSRSSIRSWPPRIAVSGIIAALIGSLITVLGYLLLVVLLPNRTSPNHALQRTAPGVTAHAPTACAPATFPHGLRRPPQSLSLGSCAPVKLVTTQVKVLPVELNCSRPKTASTASP